MNSAIVSARTFFVRSTFAFRIASAIPCGSVQLRNASSAPSPAFGGNHVLTVRPALSSRSCNPATPLRPGLSLSPIRISSRFSDGSRFGMLLHDSAEIAGSPVTCATAAAFSTLSPVIRGCLWSSLFTITYPPRLCPRNRRTLLPFASCRFFFPSCERYVNCTPCSRWVSLLKIRNVIAG